MGLQTVMHKAYRFAFSYVSVTSNNAHASVSLLNYEALVYRQLLYTVLSYSFIDGSSPRSGESYSCFAAVGRVLLAVLMP